MVITQEKEKIRVTKMKDGRSAMTGSSDGSELVDVDGDAEMPIMGGTPGSLGFGTVGTVPQLMVPGIMSAAPPAASPAVFVQAAPVVSEPVSAQLKELTRQYRPVLTDLLDIEKKEKELKKRKKETREKQSFLQRDILNLMKATNLNKLAVSDRHMLTKESSVPKRSISKAEIHSALEDYLANQFGGAQINIGGLIKHIEQQNNKKGKMVEVLKLRKRAKLT